VKRIRRFAYHEPASVREAVEILAAEGGSARPLAGGTDLLVDMKLGKTRPSVVVNLKRITDLEGIDRCNSGTRIGSLVRVSALEASPVVRPVRNLATIGGNLGRASPASDLAPPLIVHRAVVTLEGREGEREVPVEDLFTGPGTTTLEPTEVITSIFVPDLPERAGAAHRKLGKRGGGWDIALAGASAVLVFDQRGRVADARIALASLGPTVLRAREAEDTLRGALPTEDLLAEAARLAAEATRPITDVRASAGYRKTLAAVLSRRVLIEALDQARGRYPT
jgi:carbon-monoxide dehydrogenase medium subunit